MRKQATISFFTCLAAAAALLAGCSTDRFTESQGFKKDFSEVWKITREVVEPFGIEREDEAKGEIESQWCGSAGLFRGEATRRKVLAVVEKKEDGTVMSKLMVRQEKNSSMLQEYNEEAVTWEDDGFDVELEEALMNQIIIRLTGGRFEDDIRERLKERPDLDELDRKIEEYRKRPEENEQKDREAGGR